LFGGYHYYSLIEYLSRINRMNASTKWLTRAVLDSLPWHKAKLFAGALRHASPVAVFNYLRSCAKDFAPLVSAEVLRTTDPSSRYFEQLAAGFAADLSNAELGMRLDLGFTLSDGYLQKVDVATMAFSLEARCPLVDHRLVEWSMRLPVQYKIRGRRTKYLLKKALSRYLPTDLVYQPKRGFGVPISEWLRGPLRSWCENLINDASVMSRLPLEQAPIRDLFKLHVAGKRDAHPVLWAALMLLCFVARHDRRMDLPALTTQRAAA
jgi:asparagine synthase (glutamine-hydrolysing)